MNTPLLKQKKQEKNPGSFCYLTTGGVYTKKSLCAKSVNKIITNPNTSY